MREQAATIGIPTVTPVRPQGVRDWQRWAPYAAVAWSVAYGALGVYWLTGGRGFPYGAETTSLMGPLAGRFGSGVGWIVVTTAGIPAAALGTAMMRGVRHRALRALVLSAGAVLAGLLLLLMTGLDLLVLFGYVPFVVRSVFTDGEISQKYLMNLTRWATIHQLLCVVGGFLWLAATVSCRRRSRGACLYCGRQDGSENRQTRSRASRWGRIAVYVSMLAPVSYALTRYAWALGFPLGMSETSWRDGQEKGIWTAGLFLANFGLVGAVLTLGLAQRWGEVFPRWIIGLAGRRVPIALAVVPASLVSVLLVVGGVVIWFGLDRMVAAVSAAGAGDMGVAWGIVVQVGPTLLFPVWGVALAVAALAYYYRRRGPCAVCGRGALEEVGPQPR